MAERLNRQLVAEKAIIHEAPALRLPTTVDRNFQLPTALFALTALGYLGFLGLTATAFGNPELILPMAIIVTFLAMAFGVPAVWVRMKPRTSQRLLSWSRFVAKGVQTYTGHVTAGQASVQVLILPALVFLWGVAIVTIAAVVR